MKRLLLSVSVAWLCCGQGPSQQALVAQKIAAGGAPIALIQHGSAVSSAGSGVTISLGNTTGANFVIVNCATLAGTTCAVSDNKGNTYTSLVIQVGTQAADQLFYTLGASVGAGHTVTVTCTACFTASEAIAFSNVTAFSTQNGATANGSTAQPGSVTPGANNGVVVAGIALQPTGDVMSINSGMTITDIDLHGASNVGGAIAYIVQTSATAINPTWTLTIGNSTGSTIASFVP